MAINSVAMGDFKTLDNLKLTAKTDARKAMPEVAKQFEAIFLQAMLKSMRMGEHFLDENSPFKSEHQQTFQEMLDSQYSGTIAGSKGIGLADFLSKDMDKHYGITQPVGKTPSASSVIQSKTPVIQSPSYVRTNSAKDLQAVALNPRKARDDAGGVDDFVKSLWPYAKQAASVLGLDPKILIAQAALETGWGKSMAKDADGTSANNFFNIKSNNQADEAVSVKTTEFVANTPIKVTASFRKYATIEHSFDDYVSLIQNNGRYADAKSMASNPEGYVKALHNAGYATDPTYSDKILSIYHGDELNGVMERNGLTKS